MRLIHPATLIFLTALLAACGIPREAGHLAARHAAEPLPADAEGVRAALAAQGDAWTRLGGLLLQNEFGGIRAGTEVHTQFTAIVVQTAALARRQRELIERGEDDPDQNRAVLERLRALWKSANAYLNPP